MKLRALVLFSLPLCFALAFPVQASKIITLQDGSQIKGTLVEVSGGEYVIQTESFGTITVNESDVVSMTAPGAAPVAASGGSYGSDLAGNPMMQQVASMQTQIMADPNLMLDIQSMAEDPELVAIMSDQQFMSLLMSGNTAALQSDPRMQKLMENPSMRNLIQKIQSQHPNGF